MILIKRPLILVLNFKAYLEWISFLFQLYIEIQVTISISYIRLLTDYNFIFYYLIHLSEDTQLSFHTGQNCKVSAPRVS